MTPQLKVGDRVAVYGHRGNGMPVRGVGVIEAILRGEVARMHNNKSLWKPGRDGWDLTVVHVKQCRRLIKRERKRVWIGQSYANNYSPLSETVWANPEYPDRWIEFIEVRKK